MKLLLVNPKSPSSLELCSEGLKWWKCAAEQAPHELALLLGLTQSMLNSPGRTVPALEVQTVDQQAGDALDFQAEVDLVVVVARSEQIPTVRYLAGRFRARKIPVVLLGSFVTEFPTRADMVDIRLIGSIETVWPLFLADLLARQGTNAFGSTSDPAAPVPRVKSWEGPFPESLSDYPLPAWGTLQPGRYRWVPVEVARSRSALDPEVLENAAPTVLYKGTSRVVEELEALIGMGVTRFRLEAPDLLAGPVQARSLLEALASLNARHQKTLRFDASLSLRSCMEDELLDLMARANVRRITLTLNPIEPVRPATHAELQQASDAVRRVLERGIRVSARIFVGRALDDVQALQDQEALARDCGAMPWLRVAKVQPGTALYAQLKAEGRLVTGARDVELRHELLEAPNFLLRSMDKEAFLARLRALLEQLYAPTSLEGRLRRLYSEANGAPDGQRLPPREDLVALALMLGGSLRHPTEARPVQVLRAAALTLALRPSPSLLAPALEQVLEDAAARSFVVKTLNGLALDGNVPAESWKQKVLGAGTRLLGRFTARPASAT